MGPDFGTRGPEPDQPPTSVNVTAITPYAACGPRSLSDILELRQRGLPRRNPTRYRHRRGLGIPTSDCETLQRTADSAQSRRGRPGDMFGGREEFQEKNDLPHVMTQDVVAWEYWN